MAHQGTRTAYTLAVALLATVATAAPAAARPGDELGTRVIGGSPTTTEQHPWMVFLSDPVASPDEPSHHLCGGALVTPVKVVTAAHCVDETRLGDLDVVGGRTDQRTDAGTVRKVVAIAAHEKNPGPPPPPDVPADSRPGGDIAVLTLDRPMPYRTIPIAAPEEAAELYREGMPAQVLGWGVDSEQAQLSPTLQQAQVPVISDEQCLDTALHGSAFPTVFDPAYYVCGGYQQGGVTTSGGDSGGPLVIDGTLAGITALMIPRGDEPTLSDALTGYSRITAFDEFLRTHIASP